MAAGLNLKATTTSADGASLDVRLTWNDSASIRPDGSGLPYTASDQLLGDSGNRVTGAGLLLQESVDAVSFAGDLEPPA
jgi:hypothetical protein